MERRDFLAQLGIGAAFALTATCLHSCSKSVSTNPSGGVDFTLNLNDAANAALKTNGNYIVANDVVVARTTSGEYVAATVVCSHQQLKQVIYDPAANNYVCTHQGSRFNLQGGVVNGPAATSIAVYKTTIIGTSLRVYS